MRILRNWIGRQKLVPVVLAGASMVALLAGCSAAIGTTETAIVRPAQTAVPRGISDPRVTDAVRAYQNFLRATIQAQQQPWVQGSPPSEDADFTLYSFDPVEAEYQAATRNLALASSAYRGTPPQSHVTVTSIDPDAQPWPMVTLSDCRTGQEGWQVVDTRTGKQVPSQPSSLTSSMTSPFARTVTVVYHHQRWGVYTINPDTSRTCPHKEVEPTPFG